MKAAATAIRHGVETPVGHLVLIEQEERLVAVDWGGAKLDRKGAAPTPLLRDAEDQLLGYFNKTRRAFALPLAPAGSEFEKRAWARLCEIPFGETLTYGAMARAVGGSARSIGAAMGANPIPIFIPCHRVIAVEGKLGGYSGGKGATTKLFLLRHEGALLI